MSLIKKKRLNEEDQKANHRELYMMFLKRLLKNKGLVAVILVLMSIVSLMYAAIPFVLKEGIQRLYFIQTFHNILILAVVLIVVNILISLVKENLLIKYSLRFVADLKKDSYKGILHRSVNKFNKIGTGKTLAFLTYNIGLIRSLIVQWGASFVQQILNFTALFLASFFVDVRLAIFFFVLLPIFVVYTLIIQYIVRNYALKLMTFNKQIFQNVTDSLSDFENVKLLALEDRKANSFNRVIDKDLDARIDRTLIYQYNKVILHGLSLLLVIAFVAIGGQFLMLQELTFPEFVFFVLYIHLLFRPFEVALLMGSYFEAGKIGIKTVFPYLIYDPLAKIKDVDLRGEIEIENAVFKHPKSSFKLSKINLKVAAKAKVAVVGECSSGKSTFVDMLLHIRKLNKGSIKFDGQTADELGLRNLRRNISVVSKDHLLATGTIFSYLTNNAKRSGVSDFSDELVEMCNELGLNEKIIRMNSRKFQGKITHDDNRFSETEKIKLALVRAAYQKSPIIILDNFWHGFDEKTFVQISGFAEKHFKKSTVIQMSSDSKELLMKVDQHLNLQ